MRRFLLVFVIVAMLFVFSSCDNEKSGHYADSTKEHTDTVESSNAITNDSSENTSCIVENIPNLITSVHYLFPSDTDPDFSLVEYYDDTAEKTLKKIIFEKEYIFTYEKTCAQLLSDTVFHKYVADEGEESIEVDAVTGDIVGYSKFQFDPLIDTEEEFLELIDEYVGFDLSGFNYLCRTRIYEHGDDYTRATVVEGFHYAEENKDIGYRTFDFIELIDGYSTSSQVNVTASKDNLITVRIKNDCFDIEEVNEMIENMDKINEIVKESVKDSFNPDYVVSEVDVGSPLIFNKKGRTYLLHDCVVRFYSPIDDTVELESIVNTTSYIG